MVSSQASDEYLDEAGDDSRRKSSDFGFSTRAASAASTRAHRALA